MCEVVTASIATYLGSAGIGTYASIAETAVIAAMSYQRQKNQTAITKAVAKQNAAPNEPSAERELRRGDEQADDLARQARKLKGDQRSTMAARWLELNDGTSADLQNLTDFFALQDQLTVRRNAQESAYNFRVGAAKARAGGNVGNAAAVGSLLSGTAQVADKWYKYSGR